MVSWSRAHGCGAGRTGSIAASCASSTSCPKWRRRRRRCCPWPTGRRSRKFPPSPCAAAAAAPRSARRCSRARSAASSRLRVPTSSSASTTPDDAALVDVGGERLSLQTVDYFRAIVDDPYLLGKIAANHALGDIYAMGGEPQTALAIATVPYGLEAKVGRLVRDDGGRERGAARGRPRWSAVKAQRRRRARARLRQRARRARGGCAKAGCGRATRLILTKPIGTGTLLAADMRGKAKARWVMAAIAHMICSNAQAAAILRRHGVHAATDVTVRPARPPGGDGAGLRGRRDGRDRPRAASTAHARP